MEKKTTNPYADHKPAEGGGTYLKLTDGQTVVLRLASEPYIFQSGFTNPDGTVKYSTRYAWVIYNQDEEAAQILALSATTYRQIAALALDEDYGDPTTYNIKLKRNGTGTDTTYNVIGSPKKDKLSAEAQAKVDEIKLTEVKGLEHALPLSQVTDGHNAPKPSDKPKEAAKDVTIEDVPDEVNLDEIPF